MHQALYTHHQSFSDQKGEPTSNSTARWVVQCFVGLHVLTVNEIPELGLNLEDPHQSLLARLGMVYEAVYS